jgi:hypothetical protein
MTCRQLMKHLALAAALAVPAGAAAETLIEKVLRVSGLTLAPTHVRDPDDGIKPGSIWIVSLDRRTTRALTTDGGYRSPTFSPVAGSIYALKHDMIVRIPSEGGTAVSVQRIPGAIKLVGFDGKSLDEMLVLIDTGASGSPLGVVSLKSGRVTPLPYDARSDDEHRLLEQIRAQHRLYGDTIVYTKRETKEGIARIIEWTDVYLQQGTAPPRNMSGCDGLNCVQPALSPDKRTVAFVKTGAQ